MIIIACIATMQAARTNRRLRIVASPSTAPRGPCGDMTLAGLACMSGTDSSEFGVTAVLIGPAQDLRARAR
jgi:hypothetical protein